MKPNPFKVSAKEFNKLFPKLPKELRRMKPKTPLEKDITKEIRKFLTFKKIFHYKAWQGLGSVKGVADIIGIMPLRGKAPGVFLAIEVKTDRGFLSDRQETFLHSIRDSGGIAFVARSVQDCIDNLNAYW